MDLRFSIAALPGEKELIATLDKLLVAQSHDMSETGVCMWTSRMLVPASLIELDFPATPGEEPLRVRARVVWCQPRNEGGYLKAWAGLEFVDLSSPDRARLMKVINS